MAQGMQNPAQHLAEEQTALMRLVEKLRQEQQLLSETTAEGITDLITEKARLVAEMTTLAGQRHQYLATIGFSEDEQGMQQWMTAHGSAADKEIWAAMFELAQDARELNRVNGILIGKRMSVNQGALTALQGKTAAGTFYGPDGQSSVKSGGRRLGVV